MLPPVLEPSSSKFWLWLHPPLPTGSAHLLCRIEETWRLWCKFLDDYSRFEDWLKMAERTAASPNSADVLYSVAKEELKKFEVGF